VLLHKPDYIFIVNPLVSNFNVAILSSGVIKITIVGVPS